MTEIVGIRFKKNGKTYYFAPAGFVLNRDDRVIVDTARGEEYGYTAVANREIKNKDIKEPLRSVIRMATEADTEIHKENLRKEVDAFNTCIALIDQHKLEMKLIDVEFSFDRTKLLFYFSAEGRIDFRELVKDLAGVFHVRIEMRQIGIRDEAKILGGLGICGRPYCCSTFLSDFGQVSVKMAKEQNLSLNSAKISGACGRLMCCLRYEYDTYLKEKALTPKVDARVMTPNGPGVVTAANPLAGIVKVKLDNTPEDAEQVIFVREDVVNEADYDGQTLTKTELPERARDHSKAEFVSAEIIEAPSQLDTSAKSDPAETEQENAKSAAEESSAGKPSRRDRDRNRHHDKKNGQRQGKAEEKESKQEGKEQSDTSKEPRPEKQNERRKPQRHQNNRRPQKPAEGSSDAISEAEAIQEKIDSEFSEKDQKGDVPKKKKNHRPYYRNFKKKKPSGKGNENT
ncbi:MAG: hypothetical protein E7634_02435 [Ruminococcaceae bacterium]|nr:hypothetical protein [Oscillospiraceae bacterium]